MPLTAPNACQRSPAGARGAVLPPDRIRPGLAVPEGGRSTQVDRGARRSSAARECPRTDRTELHSPGLATPGVVRDLGCADVYLLLCSPISIPTPTGEDALSDTRGLSLTRPDPGQPLVVSPLSM